MAYRQEFLDRGDSMDGTSNLGKYTTAQEWLDRLAALSAPDTCPSGLVPSTTLLCVRRDDDKVVGMVDIRHELNDYLRRFGGHIGYSIRPDERGKGYAKAMLGMTLPEAAKVGLEKVLITCDRDNEASRRTILAWGGVMENEVWNEGEGCFVQRYWVEVKPHG